MAVPGQRTPGSSIETGEIADLSVTTAKIADDAVTYAKMQDVSATDRLLGRVSASAGVVEEVVLDTDTTLAANSDDRVSTQKAVKAYVDAAVGSGGLKDEVFLGVRTALTLSTSNTAFTSSTLSRPVQKSANYKARFTGVVYSISSPGNTIEFKTQTSYAFSRYRPSDRSTATLVAANTSIVTFDKGSALAVSDSFSVLSAAYSLTAGDIVGPPASSPANEPFCAKITGTSAGVLVIPSLIEQ